MSGWIASRWPGWNRSRSFSPTSMTVTDVSWPSRVGAVVGAVEAAPSVGPGAPGVHRRSSSMVALPSGADGVIPTASLRTRQVGCLQDLAGRIEDADL